MSCSCIYVDDYYDMPEFISEKMVKAKKVHRCNECGRDIQPGNNYEYTVGKWDTFEVYKTCTDCLSVRNAFFCRSWSFENIWTDLQEHINEGPIDSDCLVGLTDWARGEVCEMIEQSWEEDYNGE